MVLFVNLLQKNIYAEYVQGLTPDVYIKLCGVWDVTKDYSNTQVECSWGKAKFVVNGSTIIDFGNNTPWIVESGLAPYVIKSIKFIDGVYFINFLWHMNDYKVKISFVDDNTIIFYKVNAEDNFFCYDRKHYRIDGPTIKYYKPKIPNLRFRAEPSEKGKVIRLLTQNEKLLLLSSGKEETVAGVKGTWIKVLTEKGEMGWCFNSYLEDFK